MAKLEKGVAVISQSDWIEPVLCKIDKYETVETTEKEEYSKSSDEPKKINNIRKSILGCIMSKEIYRKGDRIDIRRLRETVIRSDLDTVIKCDFLEYIDSEDEKSIEKLRKLVFDFFDAGRAMDKSHCYGNLREWAHAVVEALNPSVKEYSNQQINILISLLINEKAIRNIEYQDLFNRFTEIFIKEGRVF